ncbi:hypothetical protein BH10PSE1_BH10PSE1_17450 [soil metagenome]
MDFLKIVRGIEEFIFEATSWLAFYPLTLWRIIRSPLATMEYSDREQAEPEERRYDDSLSPPLLLLATIVIANAASVAAHIPPPESASDLTKALASSPQNLVLFRSLVFSLIPLVSALTLLRKQGKKISRDSLRAPFYAQCYLAAPCAAFVSAGGIIFQRPDIPNVIGLLGMIGGAAWFLIVQTRWFRKRLDIAWGAAVLTAVWAVVRALVYLTLILVAAACL